MVIGFPDQDYFGFIKANGCGVVDRKAFALAVVFRPDDVGKVVVVQCYVDIGWTEFLHLWE